MKKITIVFFFLLLSVSIYAQWTNYQIEEGLSPKNDITAIRFDKQGTMWVATSYGVYKKAGDQWLVQGIDNIYVQALCIDRKDTKWAGIWGAGIYKCDTGKEWQKVEKASISISANSLVADQKNNIWIGTWDNGVITHDGKNWLHYTSDKVSLGDNSVLSIVSDSHNRIWIGTYHGLSMFDGSVWKLFNKQNSGLPDNDIYALATNSKNNIWIGTCDGLAKFDDMQWAVYNQENSGLPSNLILSIAEDNKGNVWVGTNKGISVFDGSDWKTYTVENSNLIENRIQAITIFDNKVYLGTSMGISVLELDK